MLLLCVDLQGITQFKDLQRVSLLDSMEYRLTHLLAGSALISTRNPHSKLETESRREYRNSDRGFRMQRVQFITHAGKQILFVDMTNCTPAEAVATSVEVQATVTEQPENSVLILVDMAGAQFDKPAMERMKAAAAYDRPYVRRSAMIGLGKEHTALKEALKIFARRDYRYFNTKEEALIWLVS